MKLLAVLLLTLGLVFEAGPSCATPAQTSMVPVAIDCSGMGDSDRSTPDSNGKDMVTACHACMPRMADAPSLSRSPVWKDVVPMVELQNAITGTALKPPTPPPKKECCCCKKDEQGKMACCKDKAEKADDDHASHDMDGMKDK